MHAAVPCPSAVASSQALLICDDNETLCKAVETLDKVRIKALHVLMGCTRQIRDGVSGGSGFSRRGSRPNN